MQLLIGSKTIQCDDIEEDKENAKHFEKLLSYLMTVGEVLPILLGMYGTRRKGIVNSILIVLQFLFTHTTIVLLDEAMHKVGYGYALLFIATKFVKIYLKIVSPVMIDVGRGAEFECISGFGTQIRNDFDF